MITNTIMPVDIYSDKLKAMFFGDYYGHTTVIVKGYPSGEILHTINDAGQTMEKDDFYQYECLEIDDLSQGTYEVYTTTADGSERSIGYIFTVTGDSKQQIARQAAETAGEWSNDNIRGIISDISDKSNVLSWLFSKYAKEENDNERKSIALVIDTYVNLLNRRIEKCCFTPQEFKLSGDKKEFYMDSDAVSVIRYDIFRKKVETFKRMPLQEECAMHEKEVSLYLYVEIGEDGLPINFTISFKPEMAVMQHIKEMTISRKEAMQRILERTIDYPVSYLQFSEQELEWVSVIDKIRVNIPLFHSPSMQYEHGIITVTPHDDDIALLDVVANNLYLAINEPEYCLESNHRRVSYHAEPFEIFNDRFGLGTEPYLYWIENKDGQIVSDIKVLNLSLDPEMGGVIYDTDEANYINERLRKLEMYHYNQHLFPYMQNNASVSVCEKIEASFAVCNLDGDTDSSNTAKNIMENNFSRENIQSFNELSQILMKDWVTYGRYRTDLLKSPFYYRTKMNTIVLPMGQNVLYKIDKFDFINGHKTEYVPAMSQSTREYRFYDTEVAYITAIDTLDMRVSGYVMLDFSKRGFTADVYKFMSVNIEVGY